MRLFVQLVRRSSEFYFPMYERAAQDWLLLTVRDRISVNLTSEC